MNRETYNQTTNTAPQDKCRIKIIGVGDGAGSALSHMYRDGCKYGASFILCNINCQSLNASPIPIRIQLGNNKLGAFNTPDIGRMEAEKSKPELYSLLSEGTELSLIIAGMGGGTGTGAAPVIASISKELGEGLVDIVAKCWKAIEIKTESSGEFYLKALHNNDSCGIIYPAAYSAGCLPPLKPAPHTPLPVQPIPMRPRILHR